MSHCDQRRVTKLLRGDYISVIYGERGRSRAILTALLLVAAAYSWTKVSRTALFWAAFILSRPLGATVGDFLDKPIAHGGLELSRYAASGWLAAFIIACIVFVPQRAEKLVQARS
jgi:uncharacterized membrane-anchored protein